jgi:hypothetical protein
VDQGLLVAIDSQRSLFGSYGPSPVVYLINAVVAAVLTWVLYYRFQLGLDSAGQKALALLCWAAIWFALSVVAAFGFF